MARYKVRSRRKGKFMAIAGTGKQVMMGIAIVRIG